MGDFSRWRDLDDLHCCPHGLDDQNALKVMMVRVSWMPGMSALSRSRNDRCRSCLDIELYQQIEFSGGRIDFGGDLGIRELIRHFVGLAELALDWTKKGTIRASGRHESGGRNPAKSRRVDKARGAVQSTRALRHRLLAEPG